MTDPDDEPTDEPQVAATAPEALVVPPPTITVTFEGKGAAGFAISGLASITPGQLYAIALYLDELARLEFRTTVAQGQARQLEIARSFNPVPVPLGAHLRGRRQ